MSVEWASEIAMPLPAFGQASWGSECRAGMRSAGVSHTGKALQADVVVECLDWLKPDAFDDLLSQTQSLYMLTRIAAQLDVILITAISALSVRVKPELAVLKRASNLIVIALVSALLGQPLVACVTPGEAMTAVEHDCCMKMASMCESSAMPHSHSCCKRAVSPQIIAVAKIKTWSGDISIPAVLVSETAPIPSLPGYAREFHESNSPPESPPKFSTVLRI